jgi:hypothetical protein
MARPAAEANQRDSHARGSGHVAKEVYAMKAERFTRAWERRHPQWTEDGQEVRGEEDAAPFFLFL